MAVVRNQKKNSNYKEASVSNQVDYEMTISYPKDFKESDDKFYASGFYTNIQSHKYVGEEYSIGLGATTIGSYDKTVDNLINKKKNDNIAEEMEVDGKKIFISQNYSTDLVTIVPFSKSKYGIVAFNIKDIRNESNHHKVEDAYKELLKKDEIKDIIKSIKVKEIEKNSDAVETDVFSVKPIDDWYVESNKDGYIELRNNDLPNYKTGHISMCRISSIKSYVSTMKKNGYIESTKKIGSNSYTVLQSKSNKSKLLVTHKKGEENGIRIFVFADLNDKEAGKVIKTVKLK